MALRRALVIYDTRVIKQKPKPNTIVQFRFRVVHQKGISQLRVILFCFLSFTWLDLRVGAVLREQNALPYAT